MFFVIALIKSNKYFKLRFNLKVHYCRLFNLLIDTSILGITMPTLATSNPVIINIGISNSPKSTRVDGSKKSYSCRMVFINLKETNKKTIQL